MSGFPPGRPLESTSQFIRYRKQPTSDVAAEAIYWGTFAAISTSLRFSAGEGGNLIDADTMMYFNFAENGGVIDIIEKDTIGDPMRNLKYAVVDVVYQRGMVKVTCSTTGVRTGSSIG